MKDKQIRQIRRFRDVHGLGIHELNTFLQEQAYRVVSVTFHVLPDGVWAFVEYMVEVE